MLTRISFKNPKGNYMVLQCPRCKKIVFLKALIGVYSEKWICTTCGVKMKMLDIETQEVEIEV